MPKLQKKKKRPRDLSKLAFDIVKEATENKPTVRKSKKDNTTHIQKPTK